MLTIAYVLSALSLAAIASPPPADAPRPGTFAIPLDKRDGLGNLDEVVDPLQLLASVQRTFSKFENGFAAYEANTGEAHPLSDGFSIPGTDGGNGNDADGGNNSGNSTDSDDGLLRRRAGSATQALTDVNNGELWQGSISVGTPAVTYTVQLDTGSSDLFLPGPSCTSSNCKGHKQYKPSSSSTAADAHQKFSLTYGDGSSVQGEQYTDTVSMAGLTATKQRLGAASTYSSGFSPANFPPDGLLGMGYQSISVYNSPPLFQSLVAQKHISNPVFAFKLAQSGSELYLGGTNSKLYTGSITYTPVTTQGYWQVALQGVTVNGNSVLGTTQSVIDTGTTLIIAPDDQVNKLYAAIPGSKDASKTVGAGFHTFPCSATENISLTFGGKAFAISPQLFNLGRVSKGSSDCVGAIVGSSGLPFWVVGDTFLQGVYSIYDMGNNRVGFAALK